MASFKQYTASGGASEAFSIQTFSSDEIKVYVDNVLKTATTHYNITNYNSNGGTVTWTVGNVPSSGTVRIVRDTDVSTARATYSAGSSVKSDDLNNNHTQALRSLEEQDDQLIQTYDVENKAVTSAKLDTNIDIAGTLDVTGAATLDSTLSIAGTTTAAAINASGAVGVDGNFDVNTNKFTVDASSGNTTVAGTLAAGATTVTGNITVSGTVDGRDIASDASKLDGVAVSANNYTHPTHPGDDFSVDTGALTGAVVVSDVDINVTTDGSGHVTDANGSVSTRTLTLANLGYTGETDATADQTGAQIKTAYEAESDTNAYTDAEKTKLAGIDVSADVTDATTVNAAGAVMNSDLDVKGEILVGDGSGDPSALGVGTNGYILTADSSEATGIKWAANAGGGGGSGASEAFKTIAVSGQNNVVADSATDTLTLAAGSNVTITTNDSTDTVTIAASGGGSGSAITVIDESTTLTADATKLTFTGAGVTATEPSTDEITITIPGSTQLTTEEVQDIAGPLVATGGTKTGIAVTYDDASGNMDFVVADQTPEGTAILSTGETGTAKFLRVDGDNSCSWQVPPDTNTQVGGATSVTFNDSIKVKLGTDTDYEISCDGTNLILDHTADGQSTLIRAKQNGYIQFDASDTGNQVAAKFKWSDDATPVSSAELYFGGVKKAETVTGGFTVTGTCTATAFAGDGSALTGVGGTITALNNATANELVTIGSTTTELDAEANLTFDGSTLAVTGNQTVSTTLAATGQITGRGFECPAEVSADWSIGAANNAMFPGPMTVANGVTVTVPANRTLTVV